MTDEQGAATNQLYTLVVGSTAINQPPSITSVPVFLASVGDPYTYQVEATDPDVEDTLTYRFAARSHRYGEVEIGLFVTLGARSHADPAGLFDLKLSPGDQLLGKP